MSLIKNELSKILKRKFIYISILLLSIITVLLAISTHKQYEHNKSMQEKDLLLKIESQVHRYEEMLEEQVDEGILTEEELVEKENNKKYLSYYRFLLEHKIPLDDWKANALKSYFLNADSYYAFVNGEIKFTEALNPELCYKYVMEDDYKAYLQLEVKNCSYIIENGYDTMGLTSVRHDYLKKCIKYDIVPNTGHWKYQELIHADSLREQAKRARESYLTYHLTEPEIKSLEVEANKSEYRAIYNKPMPEVYSLYYYSYTTLDVIVIILIIVAVLASNIISFEYEEGTHIQLYSFPRKRWKIVLAKFSAIVLISIVLLLIVFIVMLISGVLIYGTEDIDKVMLINANKGLSDIKEVNIILYTAIMYLLSISEVLMVIVLCMAVSSVFGRTVLSTSFGVGIVLIGQSFALIFAEMYKVTWAKYTFVIVMNMRQFFENNIRIYDLTFGSAVIVYGIWFVSLSLIIYYQECKHDVLLN